MNNIIKFLSFPKLKLVSMFFLTSIEFKKSKKLYFKLLILFEIDIFIIESNFVIISVIRALHF